MSVLLLSTLCSAAQPRVAVFGGSGFVGSRVCKTLTECGCRVVSCSRSGRPPAWAAAEPWAREVEWLAADAFSTTYAALGHVDAAVSCVGNMRPAPEWENQGGSGNPSFWGLHWDDETMRRENGEVTERIVELAKRSGARRFVYVSVASITTTAFVSAVRFEPAAFRPGTGQSRRPMPPRKAERSNPCGDS